MSWNVTKVEGRTITAIIGYCGHENTLEEICEKYPQCNRVVLKIQQSCREIERRFCCGGEKDVSVEVIFHPECKAVIEPHAFSLSKITHVVWPKNQKYIPEGCFAHCENLKSFTGYEDLEEVGENAFLECKKLDISGIASSANKIGANAFRREHRDYWKQWGGIDYYNSDGECVGDIVLKEGCEVGPEAFARVWAKSLTVPKGVKFLGKYTFKGAYIENLFVKDELTPGEFENANIENIKISNHITSIPDICFYANNALSTIEAPAVTKVGAGAFAGSLKLILDDFVSQLDVIGSEAFRRNGSFYFFTKSITFKPGCYIGEKAFECAEIEEMIFSDDESHPYTIKGGALNTPFLKHVHFPSYWNRVPTAIFGDMESKQMLKIVGDRNCSKKGVDFNPTIITGYGGSYHAVEWVNMDEKFDNYNGEKEPIRVTALKEKFPNLKLITTNGKGLKYTTRRQTGTKEVVVREGYWDSKYAGCGYMGKEYYDDVWVSPVTRDEPVYKTTEHTSNKCWDEADGVVILNLDMITAEEHQAELSLIQRMIAQMAVDELNNYSHVYTGSEWVKSYTNQGGETSRNFVIVDKADQSELIKLLQATIDRVKGTEQEETCEAEDLTLNK